MANQTVYPYGIGGSLPSNIGIINDRTTGGADKAWSAEQGKIACQEIEKNTDDIFEMFANEVGLTAYAEQVGWTILSTNKWQHVTSELASDYGCKLVAITPGMRYRVYGNTTEGIIAILASASMLAGESPDFCAGYGGRVVVASGGVYDFVAPEDAEYLYLLVRSSGNLKDTTVLYSDINIKNVGNEIDTINSQQIGDAIPITDGWLIQSNGTWVNSNTVSCLIIPITPGKDYRIIGGSTMPQIFALLSSDTKANNTPASFCSGESGRRSVIHGQVYNFTAPNDCAFVYLARKSSSGIADGYLAVPKKINEQLSEFGIGVDARDGFASAPEYFAWKKMEQQTNLKWTPRSADIQKASSTAKFAADTEQQGVPYSSVWEYMKFVGTDVSYHTFMTALRNKYSLIYTECVRDGYSKSSYGRTYHGAANSGPFYGNVCSGLTSYALGSLPYTTEKFAELATRGILAVVYDQSANGVLRGDLIWQTGHVRMVKDVWRKNGVTTKVLVCEEVQPQAKDNVVMTATEFNTFLAQNSMIIYRYKDLYKNINYTPSPYVAVGDETPETVTYNDDICTFAGDKASFAEGELIYIHCLNLAYPQMEIYKGNTLVETITLASDSRATKTSDDLAYAVNLSNDNLSYGMYKCRLKNGNTYSDYTYFEVIDTSVSADGAFSSTKGVAMLSFFTDSTGRDPEAMAGIDSLHSGTVDTSGADSEHPILRVIFKGEYGRVFAQVQVI